MSTSATASIPLFAQERTLSAAITRKLREMIMGREIAPGEKLSQDRLAEQFGVSRIPIREALRQLAAEGLVVQQSHRTAVVTNLSAEEVAELLAIAGTLEALATHRGAERLEQSHLDEMASLLAGMEKAAARPREWYELNVRFHMVITRASGWMRLAKLVEEARRNVMRYIIDPDLHGDQVSNWHAQHKAILDACRSRDIDSVRALLEHHWRYSSRAIIDHRASHTRLQAAGAQ